MISRFKFRDSVKLIRNIRTTGTIAPSSKILVQRLLASIDFSKTNCIVELGPGNGCVTQALLERMGPDSVLLCLEVNSEFAAQLNTVEDSRLHVYNACASSICDILDLLEIEEVDHVVSSLPLAIIEDAMVQNILSRINSNLKRGGTFLQYQYSLANYNDMKPFFSDIKLKFTLRNMPPAFVYECLK